MPRVVKSLLLEAQRLEGWDSSDDVKELLSVIKNGKILEIGCGTGRIIECLSQNLQDSFFVGIDIVDYFLDIATNKDLRNALFIKANATDKIFPDNTFDTVLFRDSLHEIRKNSGEDGVKASLKNVYSSLKDSGLIVIREGFATQPRKIRVTFESKGVGAVFSIFVKRSGRKISTRDFKRFIEMETGDLVSFLGKFRKIELNPRIKKLGETKYYTIGKYDRLLRNAGFKRLEVRLYKFPRNLIPKGISFDLDKLSETYCMLVYKK